MDDINEGTEMGLEYYGSVFKEIERLMGLSLALGEASQEKLKASGIYFNGVFKYLNEFMTPFWIALNSFNATEREKLARHTPQDSLRDYLELLQFNHPGGAKRLRQLHEEHDRFST